MSSSNPANGKLTFAGFIYDPAARAVLLQTGARVDISGRNFDVLAHLISHRDHLVENVELYEACWHEPWDVTAQNRLDRAISDLRKAVGDTPSAQRIIRREARRGVQFVAEVAELAVPTELPESKSTATLEPLELNAPVQRSSLPATARWYALTAAVSVTVAISAVYIVSGRGAAPRAEGVREITSTPFGKRVPVVFDSRYAYYSRNDQGHHSVVRYSLQEKEETPFPTVVPEPYVAAISPDQRTLLIRQVTGDFNNEESPLWLQPTDGTSAWQLEGIRGIDGVWIPGQQVLIVCRGPKVLSYDLKTKRISLLTTVDGSAWWPRINSRTDELRFTVQKTGGMSELWQLNLRDGTSRPLFPAANGKPWSWGECGSWSSDGNLFVFDGPTTPKASPRDRALWAWNGRRSSDPVILMSSPGLLRGASPSPSSNEFWIRSETLGADLFSLDRSGADSNSPWIHIERQYETASFSRNGQRIVFSSEAPLDELWIETIAGKRTRLTSAPIQTAFPEWSPDDKRIVVAERELGHGWTLRLFETGDTVGKIVSTAGISAFHPTWVGENEIVFSSIPALELRPEARRLFLTDVAKGHVQELPDTSDLYRASASPDLQLLSAVHYPEDSLWVYDRRSGMKRLMLDKGVTATTWGSDSGTISALQKNPEGGLNLVTLDVVTAKSSVMRRFDAKTGVMDRWVGYSPDRQFVLARGLNRQQFFSLRVTE